MVAASSPTLGGFRALYEEQYGFVWAAVRRFGVPTPLVEDAVQDTFIVAYRRRSSFTPGPARPWLYGIARGVASNYRRTARRVARKREALASSVSTPVAGHAQASLQALDRFLSDLSPEDRELFTLSEIEGLTGPELSKALQLKTRTVYRRLDRLRGLYAEQAIEDGTPKPRRPRASAAGWAALVPALESHTIGWLGLATLPKVAAAVGLVGAASIGWTVTRPAQPAPVSTQVAAAASVPEPPGSSSPPSPPSPAVYASPPEPARTAPMPTPRLRTKAQPPAPDPVDPLKRENTLLQRAKTAVAQQDYEAALSATSLHATEFPQSALSDLRTALRIEALCAMGKAKQGRGEAHAFIAKNPDTPLVERIRRGCMTKSELAGQ